MLFRAVIEVSTAPSNRGTCHLKILRLNAARSEHDASRDAHGALRRGQKSMRNRAAVAKRAHATRCRRAAIGLHGEMEARPRAPPSA